MPRKALIHYGDILDVLQKCKKCEVFDESYKVKCRSNKVTGRIVFKIVG